MSFHLRHYTDDDNVSIYSDSSMLTSSFDTKRTPTNSDSDYPVNWTVDDVTKWLGDISLQQYSDNFRKHNIDGSVLIDEIDGIDNEIIKQLIPPIGTQLKFRKALRILRR
jgi:hypothetical protein